LSTGEEDLKFSDLRNMLGSILALEKAFTERVLNPIHGSVWFVQILSVGDALKLTWEIGSWALFVERI